MEWPDFLYLVQNYRSLNRPRPRRPLRGKVFRRQAPMFLLDNREKGPYSNTMETLNNIPALFKVGITFLTILTCNRLKLHLSLCLFIGAGLLGFLMNMPFIKILGSMAANLTAFQSLSLVAIITIILILSKLMADSGQLDRIVTSFTGAVRSVRVAGIVMPALIGLLPMPGGALFSAPMVESACKTSPAGPEAKTAINYWFRHIWEYWWPLYPGVVLAVSLLHVETWRFALLQIPVSLVALASGIYFIMDQIPKDPESRNTVVEKGAWRAFRKEVQPITFVILAIPSVKIFEWIFGISLPPLTPVFLGLGVCLASVIIQNHMSGSVIVKAVFHKSLPPMVILVLSIMAFKGILIDTRAVDQIQAEMTAFGIPELAIILIMPFLSGFVTGIALGFVGASFPLIVPLLADKTGFEYVAFGALAFTFGHMGQMVSPVHLCFLVTKDYFSASLARSYRFIFGPVIVIMVFALVFFHLFKWF